MRWTLPLAGGARAGRPISGEAVRLLHRTLLEVGEDRAAQEVAFARLLRLSFPLRWRNFWDGDPVRQILRRPDRDAVITRFLQVPAAALAPPRIPDDWDRLEALQRPPEAPGPPVALDTVCRVTEREYGPAWYYCPDRWPTADGYAPLDEVWRAWATLAMCRAFERLNLVRAISTTKAGERVPALYEADVREALGG